MTKDQQIYTAVIIYILCYIYSIVIANTLLVKKSKLNDMHEYCLLKGEPPLPRGRNYYISVGATKAADFQHCIFTFWGLMHVIMYAILGFFCPDLFLETFLAGTLFEIYEAQYYDCHDLLDIGLNTLGFGIGYFLQTL